MRQTLSDFLRALSRKIFVQGIKLPETLLKLPRFSKWPPEQAVKGDQSAVLFQMWTAAYAA